MIKLQECQKKKASASLALSVFSGRVSLSFPVSLPLLRGAVVGAFGSSKGQDGWDALSVSPWRATQESGGMSWVAQHRDTCCFLPGSASWRYFLPSEVETPLAGASPPSR